MAYKFQMGAARLSGSLVQEGAVTAESSAVSASSITLPDGGLSLNGTAVSATADELNVLDGLAQGRILVGDGNGAAAILDASSNGQILVGNGTTITSVAVSGDATLANDGALTIAAGAVENSMLANPTLMIGDTNFTLGATGSTLTGLTDLDLAAGARTIFDTVGNNNLTIGASNTTVVIAGNLTVQGTTTTIDSTTINISSSFTFEGPADDYETILHAGTPSQDITVYLPQYSASAGAHSAYLPVLADAPTAASALVTAAEFSQLDGDTNRVDITIVNADGFLMNDGGTIKHVSASAVASYIGSAGARATGYNMRTISTGSATFQMSGITGFYGFESDHTASMNIDLSGGVDGWSNGDLVIVKSNAAGATYPLTIRAVGAGVKIDGEDEIVLESPFAAVSLVYDGYSWNII